MMSPSPLPSDPLNSFFHVIEASRGFTVKGPGGFITIDASGVVVQGTLVRINSGGSALSGAGQQAVDPDLPLEVQPVNPKPADNGGV